MVSLKNTAPVFVIAEGTKLEVLGQTHITFISQDRTHTYPVFIISNLLFDVIFGLDFLTHSEAKTDLRERKINFDHPAKCTNITRKRIYVH